MCLSHCSYGHSTVDALQQCGYSVYIFREIPKWRTEIPKALTLFEMSGLELFKPRLDPDTQEIIAQWQNTCLADLQATNPSVHFIDPLPLLSDPNGSILAEDENGAFFRDTNHLSTHRALRLLPAFRELLSGQASTSNNR